MEPSEGVSTEEHGKHLRVHGRVEAQELMADMLEQARRKISIFAPLLDSYLFSTTRVGSALASFAAAHRNNLARFLIEDVDQALRHNGRIVELCRRLSDFIKIRQVGQDDAGLREMFVIIDDSTYLHQPDTEKPDYLAGLEARGEAKHFSAAYERMWERSRPISAIHTLGL